MNRKEEISIKEKRVRELMKSLGLEGIVFKKQSNYITLDLGFCGERICLPAVVVAVGFVGTWFIATHGRGRRIDA